VQDEVAGLNIIDAVVSNERHFLREGRLSATGRVGFRRNRTPSALFPEFETTKIPFEFPLSSPLRISVSP
jgi:hypothetical protein